MLASSVRRVAGRLSDWWADLERGWRAVALAYLVVGLVVLAP